MKSDIEKLRARGYADENLIEKMRTLSYAQLLIKIRDDDPCVRTAAAKCMRAGNDDEDNALLNVLWNEKCLYTRLAVCDALSKGNADTARLMVSFLGKIGNNQYKKLPERISQKKSFPLPRDIIARTIGKMKPEVFPVILDTLEINERTVVSEALDAAGYLSYKNPELDNVRNSQKIISVAEKWQDDELVLWKAVLCLGTFMSADSEKLFNLIFDKPEIIKKQLAKYHK